MAFCEYCGSALNAGVRFCPNCGAPTPVAVSAASSSGGSAANPFSTIFSGTTPVADYDIVLISTGICPRSVCVDLLEDTMGYTQGEATRLVGAMPVKIARSMGRRQARVVAQALAEYGVQVAIFDKNGAYADLVNETTESVYNSKTGAFLASTVAVLATLTAGNRVIDYSQYRAPGMAEHLFRMLFKPAPPVHVRRPRPVPQTPPGIRPVSERPRAAAQPRPSTVQPRPAQANPRPATAQPRPSAARPAGTPVKPSNVKPQNASRPGQTRPGNTSSSRPGPANRPQTPPKNRGDR